MKSPSELLKPLPLIVAALAVCTIVWELNTSVTSKNHRIQQNTQSIQKISAQQVRDKSEILKAVADVKDILNSQDVKVDTLYKRTDDNKVLINRESDYLRSRIEKNTNEVGSINNILPTLATSSALGRFGDIVHQDHQDTNKAILRSNADSSNQRAKIWKAIADKHK